jgi:DNA-binding Xre family transcriptional regulator
MDRKERIKQLAEAVGADIKNLETTKQKKITVSTIAPISPAIGDLWVDTN